MPIPKRDKSASPYFTAEEMNQIRAAVDAVGELEGYTSVADLIEAGTLNELKRLQRKHNGKKKWPGIPAGQLRPGRRTREETTLRDHAKWQANRR